MERTTPSSSKDASGYYRMLKNNQLLQQTNLADGQQSACMLQGSFSMGASQYRSVSHFHPSANPLDHPFEKDGCSAHTSAHSSSSYRMQVPGMINYGTLHISDFQAPPSCTSPEGLLEIILVAQQKLQQLQAVVELMVRVGGDGHEHQSLAAGVKSIMSQLFAATSCLRQEPSDQISSFAHSSELRSDGFCDSALNSTLDHESMSSAMKLVGTRGVETRTPPLLNEAMEPLLIKSAEISRPSGNRDSHFNKQGPDALFDDPSNHLARSNTVTKLVEIDESLRIPCNVNLANGNEEAEDYEFTIVSRDDDDAEGENLPPGSYELVEMAAAEILAEHTHFCEICGKGFKRDANLRMHMRGHGNEFKSPAALARPDKSSGCSLVVKPRRYSCPFLGCKRNKQHTKFQPLKTTLCVKNHYRRSHCPKLLTCSKCKIKKFSVLADLKTHEKHCGQDKWQCSCGTSFSRKDKLTGHVNLFAGHAPMDFSSELEGLNGHGEIPSDCLTSTSVEGLECLGGTKTSTVPPSAGGSVRSTTFDSAYNVNGTSMTDLPIMDGEIFMGDESDQQHAVLYGEKNILVGNTQRGAVEVFQNCG